jgi:leader peptidase (prepilin peptidase)/N-methyltransferase
MLLIVPVLLGWAAGLTINYLADVLPAHRRLAAPTCPRCEAKRGLFEYLLLRPCPNCGLRRDVRAWLVAALALGATVWMWVAPPARLGFPLGYLLLVYFGAIIVIDLEHRLILHPVSLAGAALGLLVGVQLHGPWLTLLGGLAGFLGMLGLYALGTLFAQLMGRLRGRSIEEEALGFGDVNLAGVLGLMLGWPGILLGLFLGIVAGGLGSLAFLLGMALTRRYRPFMALPYGPYLVAGAAALLYFREAWLAFGRSFTPWP